MKYGGSGKNYGRGCGIGEENKRSGVGLGFEVELGVGYEGGVSRKSQINC